MYHINLPQQPKTNKIDYSNLQNPSSTQDKIQIDNIQSDNVPKAPDGFFFFIEYNLETH